MTAAPRRVSWLFTHLATAALLLVTLGLGYVAFVRDAGRQPDTPTGVLVAPLIDATVDTLPNGRRQLAVERWRFTPGPARFRQTLLGDVQLIAVESGEIGGSFDGEERTLRAGDPVVARAGQDVVLWNAGTGEAIVLILTFPRDATRPEYDGAAMRYQSPIQDFGTEYPGGRGRIVLERLTVEPGAALPPYETIAWQWFGVLDGVVGMTLTGGPMPSNDWTPGQERLFRLAWQLPKLPPGVPVALRNAGEESLVLYRLAITPLGPDAAERDG